MSIYLVGFKTDGKNYTKIQDELAKIGYSDFIFKSDGDFDLECRLKADDGADAFRLSMGVSGPSIKLIMVKPYKG